MAGRFSKQAAPYLGSGRFINGNNSTGDVTPGGQVTSAPSGVTIPQWEQNTPGDRFILDPLLALAMSNNAVGNLYTGTYRYVGTRNNSTSVPQRGRACFWDLTAISANASNNNTTGGNFIGSPQTDALYQVNSDEPANIGVVLMAGVYINNVGNGNFWFIQESGKATVQFRGNNGNTLFGGAALTGTPAIGVGVYLAAVGNNNNLNTGLFDVWFNANAGTTFSTANSGGAYNAIDNLFTRYVGPAETAPSNGNFSIVDIGAQRMAFRW
jgi:hypothetical protein